MRGERDALAGLSVAELDALQAENEAAAGRLRDAVIRSREAAAAAETTQCSLCMARPRDCALNCGHVFCRPCAERVHACPHGCGAITTRSLVLL